VIADHAFHETESCDNAEIGLEQYRSLARNDHFVENLLCSVANIAHPLVVTSLANNRQLLLQGDRIVLAERVKLRESLSHSETLGRKSPVQPVVPDMLAAEFLCFGGTERTTFHVSSVIRIRRRVNALRHFSPSF